MIPLIPKENVWSYQSIPRNKDLNLAIANHCNAPSRQLVIDWKGDCFVCGCEAWLPISVGKITDFQQLTEIWNSPSAVALQQDINDQKFSHCAVDRCGVTDASIVYDRYTISINIDESCNLRCPSCRKDLVMLSQGAEYITKLAQVHHTVRLLEQSDLPCHIVMSGNGDPLASHIMRPLIQNFKPRPNQTIRLFTNGLLLIKQLQTAPITDHVTQYFISIDAGSESVYEKVRLGGRWKNLIENFDYLRTVVASTGAEVLLKFVLQSANWRDMQNFCDLCVSYEFNGVINKLEDWATWTNFHNEDVIGNQSHPEHQAAKQYLASIYDCYHSRIQFNSSLAQLAMETARAS